MLIELKPEIVEWKCSGVLSRSLEGKEKKRKSTSGRVYSRPGPNVAVNHVTSDNYPKQLVLWKLECKFPEASASRTLCNKPRWRTSPRLISWLLPCNQTPPTAVASFSSKDADWLGHTSAGWQWTWWKPSHWNSCSTTTNHVIMSSQRLPQLERLHLLLFLMVHWWRANSSQYLTGVVAAGSPEQSLEEPVNKQPNGSLAQKKELWILRLQVQDLRISVSNAKTLLVRRVELQTAVVYFSSLGHWPWVNIFDHHKTQSTKLRETLCLLLNASCFLPLDFQM